MKGHRKKKSSVGPESLRGQGRALDGGLCCREGGRESGASPHLSTDWALLGNLIAELSGSLYYLKIVSTRSEKPLPPYLHHWKGRDPGVPGVSLTD